MEFVLGSPSPAARRIAVLAGSFNPPTIAHQHLLSEGRAHADQALVVLPREFPHKTYHGATLDERVAMLRSVGGPKLAIAISEGGLYVDIARECRAAYGNAAELLFLCGRDAAERILGWDYDRPGVVEEMLGEALLLVAHRDGVFEPPGEWSHRIHTLSRNEACEGVSSSEVRDRIARGLAWDDLVPESIRAEVRRIYSP